MVDFYPGLENGAAVGGVAGNITTEYTANEAVEIGSVVVLAAAGAGERKPRVVNGTAITQAAIGVVVNGNADGTFSGTSQNSAAAAGDEVSVCTHGQCKVVIDGAVALGAKLSPSTTAGRAVTAAATSEVFGRALQAGAAAGDVILCHVSPEGIL